MPSAYEDEVLTATREELAEDPWLEKDGITIEDVRLEGVYPNTEVIVTFTQSGIGSSGYTATKSFLIYNGSYPGGNERPPVGTIAAIIATNVLD